MDDQKISIRTMTIADYDEVYALWMSIHGFGIRSLDDSRAGVEKFIRRNPSTSVVAVCQGHIIGSILCGHDGRRGCLYHVCVEESHRKNGIGQQMVKACLQALQAEGINKVNLIAFENNQVGNHFWQGLDWTFRKDVNYYECVLNIDNITRFNP